MNASKPVTPRPPLRTKLSVARGNAIQAAGLAVGAALLAPAATMPGPSPARLIVALAGYLVIYDCSHAIGHYLAGRAVGIRFRFYGIRGTDHPEDYPPGFRQLMSAMPFWSVVTDKASMGAAAPWKKALMFAAGETATAICSLAAAYAAMATASPAAGSCSWPPWPGTRSAPSPSPAPPRATTPRRSARCAPAPHPPASRDNSRRWPRVTAARAAGVPPRRTRDPCQPPRRPPCSPSQQCIDLATRVQRRRDFTAHLTGFLAGAIVLGWLLLAAPAAPACTPRHS